MFIGGIDMEILAVDDEKLMLNRLVRCIQEVKPEASIHEFRNAKDALDYAKDHKIDVAFLDIRMRGMEGLVLAKELNKIYEDLNVIFCTGYDEYVSEAFRDIRCNGYITKPVEVEDVREELSHLRIPMKKLENKKRIKIQCFGHFAVYCDDKPVEFSSAKTQELFAYLVNGCGGTCNNQEIMTYLWDDDGIHDSYYKKLRKDLFDTFERYGCDDVVVRTWGGLAINPDMVDCDYYKWRENNTGDYTGEYMTQYYWMIQ